ncbi:MAG: hypothetical protein HOW73_12205 [Polyangiaceae bacterium]|nr:hypothetical protein [Polyangiaceae bacterium]
MATIHLNQTTTLTPAQFLAGLTDFGPGRAEIFERSSNEYTKVHGQSPGHADVTEGSSGIWERLDYDWTDPKHIVLKTTDSNFWGGDSSHTYTLKELPDGMTEVDLVVVREGKNIKGKLLEAVVGTVGKGIFAKSFEKSIKAMEARSNGAKPS